MKSAEERVVAAGGAMQEMMAVSEKADLEITGYRDALTEIMTLAGRNGPRDPIEALNKIADRAKSALSE